MCEFADRTVSQRWPEARVDELDEALLGGLAVVEFQPVEPKLRIVEEVECSVGDLLIVGRAVQAKEPLTAI
jgi:hypothetical protein